MKLLIERKGGAKRLSREMETLLRRAARLSLLRMKADPKSEVGLILTDDPGIWKLNRDYRGYDQPTDVLAFAVHEGQGRREGLLLGDIVISTDRASEQASAYGHSFEREMAFLTVHGMLHLLGLDHMTDDDRAEMEKLQRQILRALDVPR